jgi:hypothetical protein
MARVTQTTLERTIPINDIADLTDAVTWFHALLPDTAEAELASEQSQGNLLDPVTTVDGRKSDDLDAVKLFGNITYNEAVGPIDEAIAAAWAYVKSRSPRRTGHYALSLQWFANGQHVAEPPSAARIGLRGNAELMDLAPYASMVEIMVPNSVIYGAYTLLRRRFGKSLSIGFRYSHADKFGGFMVAPGLPQPKRPYAIPVLSIGNPVSTVKPGVARSTPGYSLRRKRGVVRKYLRAKGLV